MNDDPTLDVCKQVKYDKHYEGDENTLRLIKFLENREKIAEHNRKFESGQVTYSMAINQYGDLVSTYKQCFTPILV